jgi:hypothetical protein
MRLLNEPKAASPAASGQQESAVEFILVDRILIEPPIGAAGEHNGRLSRPSVHISRRFDTVGAANGAGYVETGVGSQLSLARGGKGRFLVSFLFLLNPTTPPGGSIVVLVAGKLRVQYPPPSVPS